MPWFLHMCMYVRTVVPCSHAYSIVAAVPSMSFLLPFITYILTCVRMYVRGYQHDSNCSVANRNSIIPKLKVIVPDAQ